MLCENLNKKFLKVALKPNQLIWPSTLRTPFISFNILYFNMLNQCVFSHYCLTNSNIPENSDFLKIRHLALYFGGKFRNSPASKLSRLQR